MAWERVYSDIDNYASEVRQVYAEAEEIMLRAVASRLERGVDYTGWAEKKLAEVQGLNDDINRAILNLKGSSVTIEEAIGKSYDAGYSEGAGDIRRAKLIDITADTALTRGNAIKALVKETVNAIETTHLQMLRSTMDVYRSAVASGSAQVLTGTQTVRQAVQGVLNKFADAGITGYKDSAGRFWNAQSYAEMAVRTAAGNAATQGHIDKLQANGYDLGIVSSHGDCCSLCAPWEGKVLSFSGTSDKYPSLESAKETGFKHPNCRHRLGLFIEGLTRPNNVEYDPEAYKARETQRGNERAIRRWKMRDAAAITPEQKAKANAKVKEWQAIQREHIKAANAAGEARHGDGWITLMRRSDREQIR